MRIQTVGQWWYPNRLHVAFFYDQASSLSRREQISVSVAVLLLLSVPQVVSHPYTFQ